ncbi:transcription factor IBH1-like 1 [Ipomoea triloba]|uniref:transcription factor IBH1-like 1 n=1 Tax=Ipomoea triloba TaxID=35885 RepID=UPI00125D0529|nr:transcription factor IBH1-like 1 [Ipomoea triloba]
MQTAISSVKEEFLKKWIKGLQTYDACKREMSVTERKNAIKLSADIAMASTTTTTTKQCPPAIWRRSVMAAMKSKHAAAEMNWKKSRRMRRRCLMKRIRRGKRKASNSKYKAAASCSAKRLVKKRSAVLKGLIPGGECMEDDNTLIKETLDYILALRLQVDVMRHLASASSSS